MRRPTQDGTLLWQRISPSVLHACKGTRSVVIMPPAEKGLGEDRRAVRVKNCSWREGTVRRGTEEEGTRGRIEAGFRSERWRGP